MLVVTVLLILSMLCFLVAVIDYPPGHNVGYRLIAAGLFLWVLTVLISKGQ